ncbi:hypothetical protein BGZ80_001048 [Entomortierella chlamydospora]|uniref:SH3 domain-containing protein n=1 Tax=Entomortierella chlamydospora TaxID=101097 RepID=A0A9P6SY15_9FUNG|nr:hypothetical protein BGZ79_010625 [Entomortierella chlamydospora]KAG0010974.1 hypothetical protein BGZ80_001048 [Entomortierella chlamydospora]
MRYSPNYHALAVVAFIAISGSLLSSTTDALPISNNALQPLQNTESGIAHRNYLFKKRGASDPLLPSISSPQSKSPSADSTSNSAPKTSQTHNSDPSPSKAPSPSSSPAQAPHTTSTSSAQSPSKSSNPSPNASPSSSASHTSTKATKQSSAPSASASRTTPNNDSIVASGTNSVAQSSASSSPGDSVPTQVSQNVLIGIGAVCGLLVFVFGAMAFCRHRKKKNLATALLQQTAQFNHNNPYAKMSEPTTPSKESLPTAPTRPLGTYNVVATYTPALADEIEIGLGESVTILQEYDDGWCLGVNNSRNGIQGVFPRHCLEGYKNGAQYGGGNELGYYPPNAGFKAMANKRMSSIPAGGWNNGPPGGYNGDGGYGNYPSKPMPQYNDQGYYNGGGGY